MALREELEQHGAWLFRWRSYLPLFMIPLFVLALRNYRYPAASHGLDQLWSFVCLAISLAGLAVRTYATSCAPRGTSGRNTQGQAANVLNTTGLYSVVRHPLYLGNFLIWLGIVLSIHSWWFTTLGILIYWMYYERIMFAEEEYLRKKFGNTYLEWANRTPTFIPRLSQWRPPELPFSWRNAFRREYSGLFGIVSVFTVLALIKEALVEKEVRLGPGWIILFGLSLGIYLALLLLKKKTRLLEVEGR